MVAPDEPVAAYVLHTRPYRETSALVDFFTLEHGKVSAVVKGLRRPGSKQRAVIQPFIPLQIRWRGRQDLKSLISAEAVGHNGILTGNALMCGLYVNELLQRLLMPFDGVPRLYVFYQYVITALVQQNDVEGALRTFERQILQETGYGLDYSQLMADHFGFPATSRYDDARRATGRCAHAGYPSNHPGSGACSSGCSTERSRGRVST
jgi:DNA repair protein RecO (recombination protein O)